MRECERRDQHRQDPRVELGERSDRDPEADEDEFDREPGGGEEAALAEAVAAAEPQHHGEQRVVDADERDRCRDAGGGEAEVAAPSDCLDDDPGGERAENVVGEVEEVDVPRVAAAQELREVQGGDEGQHQQRREHERARDDERGPGVQAVVAADADAEERRNCSQRQEQRECGPVVAFRTMEGERRSRGGECQEADRRDVESGDLGQAAHAPGLPPGSFGHCWDAAHLPHLTKVGDKPRRPRCPLTIGSRAGRRYPS